MQYYENYYARPVRLFLLINKLLTILFIGDVAGFANLALAFCEPKIAHT